MSDSRGLPTSGYSIEHLFAARQQFEMLPASDEYPSSEDANLSLGWDWRVATEELFEVSINLRVNPTKERPERAGVLLVGVFKRAGAAQTVDFLSFVRLHAPSILMPYAREIITALTGRGFYGPVYLPPLNIAAITQDLDPRDTTGARQIEDEADLVARFGLDLEQRKQLAEAPAAELADSGRQDAASDNRS